MAWVDSPKVLEYSNGAVQFRIYRRHFQPRFIGEDDFKYSSGILDYDWPKYDMREWAFYPHVKAAVGDSQWHHFAVAYDDQNKRIIGWRDGELISVIDLSTTAMEPLLREGLKEIVTGEEFVGYIDEIRIYNRVLTDADMLRIFNSTKSVYAGRHDTNPTDKEMDLYKYQERDRTLYRAWLQYNRPSGRLWENCFKHIIAEGSNSTVRTAAAELTDAVVSMFDFKPSVDAKLVSGPKVVLGTGETSSWIHDRADKLELDRIKNDGFIIKALEDGSVIDGVHYKDITMEKTFVPIFMKVSDVARVPEGAYKRGAIRNVTFENITATDCFSYFKNREMPCIIWGKPGSPIENIELKNVRITAKGGHLALEASLDPEENNERFPRHVGAIPAYAWYLRHVRNVRFLNCRFRFEKNDDRPALVVDDGENVAFEQCDLQKGADCVSRVGFHNAAGADHDL
jgi:hypothetical protein